MHHGAEGTARPGGLLALVTGWWRLAGAVTGTPWRPARLGPCSSTTGAACEGRTGRDAGTVVAAVQARAHGDRAGRRLGGCAPAVPAAPSGRTAWEAWRPRLLEESCPAGTSRPQGFRSCFISVTKRPGRPGRPGRPLLRRKVYWGLAVSEVSVHRWPTPLPERRGRSVPGRRAAQDWHLEAERSRLARGET